MRLLEDFFDEIGPEIQDDAVSVSDDELLPSAPNPDDYTHTLEIRVDLRSPDYDNIVIPLKKWTDKFSDALAGYQFVDSFHFLSMTVIDANHSATPKNGKRDPDDFTETFDYPFDDEFDLSGFYRSKSEYTSSMMCQLHFKIPFNPAPKMPFKRFVNQFGIFSWKIYSEMRMTDSLSTYIYFNFYDNKNSAYSLNTFQLCAGMASVAPLNLLYERVYGEPSGFDKDDDFFTRKQQLSVRRHLDFYMKKMKDWARKKHGLNVRYLDKWEERIRMWDNDLKNVGWKSSQPSVGEIIMFSVRGQEKTVNLTSVEDTIVNGFFSNVPINLTRKTYFIFVMKIEDRLVDDEEKRREAELKNPDTEYMRLRWLKENSGKVIYNEGTTRQVVISPHEIFNSSSDTRKIMWRIRGGKFNNTWNSGFEIVCTDRNGRLCRAENNQIHVYGDFTKYWKCVCELIEKNV